MHTYKHISIQRLTVLVNMYVFTYPINNVVDVVQMPLGWPSKFHVREALFDFAVAGTLLGKVTQVLISW